MFEIKSEEAEYACKILVIGVGGAGNNAVNRMLGYENIDGEVKRNSDLESMRGVDFIGMNTDKQALGKCRAANRLQIGEKLTKGLGAGSQPEVGTKAAEESIDDITGAMRGYDMVVITCGMGGGTGTGAAPIVAKAAKDMGILTLGIVTKPFQFEGAPRMKKALEGIAKLQSAVDTLIVIPNEKLRKIVDRNMGFGDAMKVADEVLQQSVQGITDLINVPSLINLDFADVRTTMKDKGIAHIGIGVGKGDDKAMEAVKQAVGSPLLETTINGAQNVIINISGDITLDDVGSASDYIMSLTGEDTNVIFGAQEDRNVSDTIRITVIATGLEDVERGIPAGGQVQQRPVQPARRMAPGMGMNPGMNPGMGMNRAANPGMGMNQGMQPIVGYNYGAEKYDRMLRCLWLTIAAATAVLLVGWTLSMLFPQQIARIFTTDPTLLKLSARGIRIDMLVFFVVGSQAVITNFFQCIGKVKVSIFLSLSRQLFMLLPMAYVFPIFWNLDGVWYAMPASDFGSFSMTIPLLWWYIKKLKTHEQ